MLAKLKVISCNKIHLVEAVAKLFQHGLEGLSAEKKGKYYR